MGLFYFIYLCIYYYFAFPPLSPKSIRVWMPIILGNPLRGAARWVQLLKRPVKGPQAHAVSPPPPSSSSPELLAAHNLSFNIGFPSCVTDSSIAHRVWVSMEVREEQWKVCAGDDVLRQQRYSNIVRLWPGRAAIVSDSNNISHIQGIV